MSRKASGRSIVLIGFFGTGKSEVGWQLALQKGLRFLEMEELVEESMGLPLPWILSERGAPAFRDAESTALKKLTREPPAVIAACATVVRRPLNITRLRALGTVVRLTANTPALLARLDYAVERPLLPEGHLQRTVRRLLDSWEAAYHQAADFTVDTSVRTPEQAADDIQELLAVGKQG
ncbi:MAG TPA: shikimate kinase [Chthoniobacterales bacterium]